MANDPAFLFYPGDWLGGTMTFTRSHKGAYMDVLMAQFNNGHLSEDDIKFILGSDFDAMWESKLKSKFLQDSDGRFYNEKLENEIIKRRNFSESRRKNLNGTKKQSHHKDTHMDDHKENGNVNENTDGKEKGGPEEKTPAKDRRDFIDQLLAVFSEEYQKVHTRAYELINPGKERKAMAGLLAAYKKKYPAATSEQTSDGMRLYFSRVCNIQDRWLRDHMSPSMILAKFNEINNILTKSDGTQINDHINEAAGRFANEQDRLRGDR